MRYRRALTEQFYQWEQKGRGWHLFETPVDLEPVFEPFFGHFVPGEIIDDGVRLSWWHKILSRETVPADESADVNPNPPEVLAYGNTDYGDDVIYTVSIPKGFASSPSAVEHLLAMLALAKRAVSFELVATSGSVTLQFVCKPSAAYWLTSQLRAYLPECTVMETHRDMVAELIDEADALYATDFGLSEEFMRPIAVFDGKGHEPYTALFGVVEHLQGSEAIVVQVLFCGVLHPWAESIMTSVTDYEGGSFFHNAPEMPKLAQDKTAHPLVSATMRLVTAAETERKAQQLIQQGSLAIGQASASSFNSLTTLASTEYDFSMRLRDIAERQSHRLGMLLNVRELATLVHVPSASLSRKLLASTRATKRAPSYLNDGSYVLGLNPHQGEEAVVGIDTSQRTRHIHVLGGSGVGKSTLLHSLISQDIEHGRGCCVLDPHGDLIDNVLNAVPGHRVADVLLVDPSDSECPIGFNILSAHSDLERELLASDLVALFRRFSTSWGDNLHSVLANAIMAFLYNAKPGHLGDLRKFLIEKAYRERVLSTCTDEELRYYWRVEYPLIKTSSIGSILTRLDSFLRPRAIRNMVCQRSGLDFGALMDGSKIILVKLSQGLIGAENSYLLGACIVAKLQQCAMARQQQSARDRVPFFCYIDEFHHFVTDTMSTILSGARKYNFGLVLAHQQMQQVQRHDDIVSALMGNVGTRICFRLSDTDAKRMQEGFSRFSADDLQNLGVGEAVARVNTADADFSLSVMQTDCDFGNTDHIVAMSRARYGVPVAPAPRDASDATPHEGAKTQAEPQPVENSSPHGDASRQKEMQEHRYLQNFIKLTAEQHGYRASIEVPTPDNDGLVDVELLKESERIAVEVSVTTSAEWELHNVQKCLRANYAKVVVCSKDRRKLERIRERISREIPASDAKRILLVAPEEIATLLAVTDQPREASTTMKGYRVRVRYDESASDPARGEIINRIIRGAR